MVAKEMADSKEHLSSQGNEKSHFGRHEGRCDLQLLIGYSSLEKLKVDLLTYILPEPG